MEKVALKASERKETGKVVRFLRRKGLLPAVVYGQGMEAVALSLDAKAYKKVISGDSGSNVIITLDIYEGKKEPLPVITHAIQHNALTDAIIHVDFLKINMKEKIHTKIKVEIIGVATGVKDESGILVHSLTDLEINCLPMDIPDQVEIDISALKIGDSFNVSDLRSILNSEIEILTPETETVVQVVPPAKEEEVAPPPPVEGEIPAEGEAAAEGAAPAEGEAPKDGAKPAEAKAPEKKGK
ncbi:MAG: 50S ribosomal protein L25 [Candidatus Saganbacteria bacterium]|nr:50S ribosomal protein L25 [Candidatus Saganbacteria bacterium]